MSGVLDELFDLTGRVAIVTGGSRGLGLQIGGHITGQTLVIDGGASII